MKTQNEITFICNFVFKRQDYKHSKNVFYEKTYNFI